MNRAHRVFQLGIDGLTLQFPSHRNDHLARTLFAAFGSLIIYFLVFLQMFSVMFVRMILNMRASLNGSQNHVFIILLLYASIILSSAASSSLTAAINSSLYP